MSLVLNVEILGEFRKLTEASTGATKQLSGLQSSAQNISRKIGRAFATIGVGLSFAAIVKGFKDSTKAAVEDRKSQELLAIALRNTADATDSQIASVEESINKMSMQAAVADDELRPAFANLVRATGDLNKSTELMSLALDVSAGSGKSLDSVVKALSKAVGPDGTTGALERLVPAIKGAKDPMAELERIFAGSAEKAANTDPYQRMKIALDEISETIGVILLPILESFSAWISEISPDVQKFFKQLTDPTTEMGAQWAMMWQMIGLVGKQFDGLMKLFGGSGRVFTFVMNFITRIAAGLGQIMFYLGRLAAQWNAVFSGDFQGAIDIARTYTRDYQRFVDQQNKILMGTSSFGGGSVYSNQNITFNLTGTNVTPQDIIDKLNKYNLSNGSTGLIQ